MNQYGTRLQGRITNTSEETIVVVDMVVTFFENETILTTAYDGTCGLTPESTWMFDVAARGQNYAKAADDTLDVIAEQPASNVRPRQSSANDLDLDPKGWLRPRRSP